MRILSLLCLLAVSSDAGHTFLATQEEDPAKVATDFLTLITSALEKSDYSKLAGYFHSLFKYKGCTKVVSREDAIGFLSKVPKGTKFSFTLLSAKSVLSGVIKYKVKISGFSIEMQASFYLLHTNGKYELLRGYGENCSRVAAGYGGGNDGSEAHVTSFLEQVKSVLRRPGNVYNLMDRDFSFEGCKRKYSRDMVVYMINRLPKTIEPSFNLVSSKYTERGASSGTIEYVVEVSGFGANTLTAQFTLNYIVNYASTEYKLLSGKIPNCSAN